MKPRVVILAFALAAATALMGASAFAADSAKGKKVFNKCKACHSLAAGKNKIGPSLHGVIGRDAGAVKGFRYSKAMKASGITWSEENISNYLEKPKKFIPGNRMAFPGLRKEADRDNVIAYIKENAM